ncbi:MAG TPA: hypothetical protein V6C76_11465 [Drouetiella sp.]
MAIEVTEDQIVQEWDGMVCDDADHFYDDIDSAVESIVDDTWSSSEQRYILDSVPEFVECCEKRAGDYELPDGYFTEELAVLVDRIDESDEGSCNDGDTYFSQNMTESEFKQLDERVTKAVRDIVKDWMVHTVDWQLWFPCGKYIRLKPLIDKYIAEREIEDGVKLT